MNPEARKSVKAARAATAILCAGSLVAAATYSPTCASVGTHPPASAQTDTGLKRLFVQMANYVSPDGSDSNLGTKAAPFHTIAKARDVVRTVNTTMTGDIVVKLRGGTISPPPVGQITSVHS